MRRQDKSTPPVPPVPPITKSEQRAQSFIGYAFDLATIAMLVLEATHHRLPDPANGDDMGEGTIPESLTYSLRGSIECALHDHLHPVVELLREAIEESPARLARDWQERKGKGKR